MGPNKLVYYNTLDWKGLLAVDKKSRLLGLFKSKQNMKATYLCPGLTVYIIELTCKHLEVFVNILTLIKDFESQPKLNLST
jgi:hypothetical protein